MEFLLLVLIIALGAYSLVKIRGKDAEYMEQPDPELERAKQFGKDVRKAVRKAAQARPKLLSDDDFEQLERDMNSKR